MMAMAARLYVNVTKDFHTNTGETEFLGSTNMKEFNESILMIAHAVKEFKQDMCVILISNQDQSLRLQRT